MPDAIDQFMRTLSRAERARLKRLSTPARIQGFLDGIPYSTDDRYRSPLSVLRDERAHCYDGALFAAAALHCIGDPPLIVDMFAYRDDDHVLALFQRDGHWGAVAKSNFVGLRYREPIHRTLRELMLSYFEDFYNVEGLKTLRSYTTPPLDLRRFDRVDWMTSDVHLDQIADRLDALRRVPLLTKRMIARLSPMDERAYAAGMLGTDAAGLYQPE